MYMCILSTIQNVYQYNAMTMKVFEPFPNNKVLGIVRLKLIGNNQGWDILCLIV
jgi:hypothetical protein